VSGLTAEGFERALQEEIAADIATDLRGTISAQLDVSESTAVGNIVRIFADHLAQAWEVLEEAVNGFDPDNATDARLVALSLLTGVTQDGETKGLCTCTVNLDASQTYAAGDLVAHVADEPDNRWVNRDEVSSTTAGNYSAVFEAETAGSEFNAAAGTLTIIAGSVAGWNSITNAADATPGNDVQDIEDLRAEREASLARAGSGTVDAMRADVLQVDGVEQVLVEENTTDATVGALSPHSFRVVVWDGDPGAADDDEIAQAIHDTRPAGIPAIGDESGTATKADGTTTTVAFQRATAVPIFIDVEVVSEIGVAAEDVQNAILEAVANLTVGADVVYYKILSAVFAVDGVDDVTFVQTGISASPSGTANISIDSDEIATFDASDIVVTGDAS
jgi:uncharacterized phage protein gp47/JayE